MQSVKNISLSLCLQIVLLTGVAEALSLQGTVDTIVAKHPQRAIQQARLEGALAARDAARAPLLPTILGDASVQYTKQSSRPLSQEVSTTLELRQTVLDGSALKSLVAARTKVSATTLNITRTRQTFAAEIAAAYIDAWEALTLDSISRSNCKLLQQHTSDTRTRFEAGELTRTDMLWAQGRLNDGYSAQLAMGQALCRAANRLQELGCSELPDRQMPLLRIDTEPVSDTAVIGTRPDIVAMEKEIETAQILVLSRKWQNVPSISGFARAGYSIDRLTAINEAGLHLNIPVIAGGQRTAAIHSAVSVCKESSARRELLVASALRELRDSRLSVNIEQQSLSLAAERDSIAQLVLEGTTEEFKAGTRTIQDAHDAQNELFIAHQALVQQQATLLRAIISLRLASGTLDINKMEDR